jgi:hypothetical protein
MYFTATVMILSLCLFLCIEIVGESGNWLYMAGMIFATIGLTVLAMREITQR